MKATYAPPIYDPPASLREESASSPSELEVQALWFEQLHESILKTDDGRTVEVIQPGFWNHQGGPDFTRAALRFSHQKSEVPEITVGSIEVHLRAADWQAHGHDEDPAYDETVLHVVWEAPEGKAFFPATTTFRRVPQVVLSRHLVAPWAELRPLCDSISHRPLPSAVPGRCSSLLTHLPAERVVEILRAAGLFRVRQKAARWHWRQHLTSPSQMLFEALAEALGFHANQIPMRLVAQRLPWKDLRSLDPSDRAAHLFGLSGFLPDQSVARLESEPRAWLRELWEKWWKVRGSLDHALLSRSQWHLAGLRPMNRPERRLAALAQIVPRIPELLAAVRSQDAEVFSALLLGLRDPFWEKHATLTGSPLRLPCRLVGEERVHDILINLFWPLVWRQDPVAAQKGLEESSASLNSAARVATQRMLLATLSARNVREALVQQGLLQIFRDYCQTDCSQCQDCTFPELVQSWPGTKS